LSLLHKKKIAFLIGLLACCYSFAQNLATPTFSYAPGFYPDSIFLTITSDPNSIIHYTLNGDEPTLSSPIYTSALLIKSKAGRPNTFSLIPTNPSFNYPLPGYDTSRANSRGWLPPLGEVYKIWVVKAKSFRSGSAPSETAVATYIIDPLLNNRYSLPVLSISADSNSFFSDSTGIYVYGINSTAEGNYSIDGVKRKVHVQFFEKSGELVLSQYCNVKNHGGGGRHAPQKSLQLEAEKDYGSPVFSFKPFEGKVLSEFNSLLLRNGGHRPDCYPRDDLAGNIVKHLDFEVQYSRHAIVFINGEYWGIQTIKDVFDEHYLSHKYHLNKDNVVVLELSGFLDDGLPGDNDHYLNMRDFAVNNDMTSSANYNYIKTQMDADNFIDYVASEVYFGNGDWPNNNIKFWRLKSSYNPRAGIGRDGRWRWMMYDLDAGFSGDCIDVHMSYNALSAAVSTSGGNSTRLLRALLNNQEFKNQFINRSADLLNTTFLPQRVQTIESSLFSELNPEMPEHIARWRYPSIASTLAARASEVPSTLKWNNITSELLEFANRRPGKVRAQYMNLFALSDTLQITVDVSDTLAGRVKISTLLIDKNIEGVNTLPYPWMGKYFIDIPVPLKAIARPGYRFLRWNNTNITEPEILILPTTDTMFKAVFAVDSSFVAQHYLYINEISADNRYLIRDEYDEYNDWMEIYNPNGFPVDIDNYYLSDTLGNKKKFRISSGNSNTVIPAKGFKLIWADEQMWQGSLHANFKFSAAGEQLFLVLPDGNTVVDSIIFSSQAYNHSLGRAFDGSTQWIDFEKPTPGRSNYTPTMIDETEPLLVYPNPSKNSNRIFFNKPVNYSISNSLGQAVLSGNEQMSADISLLNSGIYLIRTDKGETAKWIKL
jgi:hypothetical protein